MEATDMEYIKADVRLDASKAHAESNQHNSITEVKCNKLERHRINYYLDLLSGY